MLRHALVLFAVCSIAMAAVSLGKLEEKPEEYKDREGCWISRLGTFIPLGELFSDPTECSGILCGSGHVQYQTCGVRLGVNPHEKKQNLSLPYPDCCQYE